MGIADTSDVRTRVSTPIGELELWAQSATTVLVRAGRELVDRYAQPAQTYETLKLKRGVEVDRVHWHYHRQPDGSWKPYSVGSARRPDGSDLPPTADTQLRETIAAAIGELEQTTDLLTRAAQLKREGDAREMRTTAERLRTIAAQYDAEADELANGGGDTVYLRGRMPNGHEEYWRCVKRPDGTYSAGVDEFPSQGNYTRPYHPDMVRDVREES